MASTHHRSPAPSQAASQPTPSSDAQAINELDVVSARQLVKEMIAAFDAKANKKRLAQAILEAQDDTHKLILSAAPVAIAIAGEALVRRGLQADAESFAQIMDKLAILAPSDEWLAYYIYVLKRKFLPEPPTVSSTTAAAETTRAGSLGEPKP